MPSRPNILLIFTDEQSASAMSCAGNAEISTPAMDSLAADSLDTIFNGFAESVADFGEAERRRLFRDNAMEIYRISL